MTLCAKTNRLDGKQDTPLKLEGKMTNKLLQTSTRSFITEARQANNYKMTDFIHGYVYGRWIYQYIGIGKGEHPLRA